MYRAQELVLSAGLLEDAGLLFVCLGHIPSEALRRVLSSVLSQEALFQLGRGPGVGQHPAHCSPQRRQPVDRPGVVQGLDGCLHSLQTYADDLVLLGDKSATQIIKDHQLLPG